MGWPGDLRRRFANNAFDYIATAVITFIVAILGVYFWKPIALQAVRDSGQLVTDSGCVTLHQFQAPHLGPGNTIDYGVAVVKFSDSDLFWGAPDIAFPGNAIVVEANNPPNGVISSENGRTPTDVLYFNMMEKPPPPLNRQRVHVKGYTLQVIDKNQFEFTVRLTLDTENPSNFDDILKNLQINDDGTQFSWVAVGYTSSSNHRHEMQGTCSIEKFTPNSTQAP